MLDDDLFETLADYSLLAAIAIWGTIVIIITIVCITALHLIGVL